MDTPLPEEFIQRLRRDYPLRADAIASSLNGEPSLSIRWNTHKAPLPTGLSQVPWSKTGFYLHERPTFAADPWWHAGVYYVQEASSMMLEQAVQQIIPDLPESLTALDLSAAPGGKTLLLDQCLPDDSLIVSNEIIPKRAQILRENVLKWGSMKIAVTNNAPSDFTEQEQVFDLILVDAPCSGEGMFRKDDTARSEWTPESGAMCSARQSDILNDIWPTLSAGGYLIYSTCTFDRSENLDAWAHLDAEQVEIELDPSWGVERIEKEGRFGYQCFTDKVKGEGFFFTVLKKTGESMRSEVLVDPALSYPEVPWVNGPFDSSPDESSSRIYVTSTRSNSMSIHRFRTKESGLDLYPLKVIHDGPIIAERKGHEWRPTTEVVWSEAYNGLLPRIELELPSALDYLHGMDIRKDLAEPGYVVLTYRDVPIGVGKQVKGRINNAYPKPFRLRKHPSTLELTPLPW